MPATSLRLATFNILFAGDDSPQPWTKRGPVARRLLQKISPDILGTQEALFGQVKDIESALSAHQWIGLSRNGGSRGEFTAVFFQCEKFELLAFDHVWLSSTPYVIGSLGDGARLPRMMTWVQLRDRRSNAVFYFLNTHLDHESQPAREEAVNVILEQIPRFDPQCAVFLAGDFNATEVNPIYHTFMQAGFRDTWRANHDAGPSLGSVHEFDGPVVGGRRIDWILAKGNVTPTAARLVTESDDGQYPSDHFPVVADVEIK